MGSFFSRLGSFVDHIQEQRTKYASARPTASSTAEADCSAICSTARGQGQFCENFAHLICIVLQHIKSTELVMLERVGKHSRYKNMQDNVWMLGIF